MVFWRILPDYGGRNGERFAIRPRCARTGHRNRTFFQGTPISARSLTITNRPVFSSISCGPSSPDEVYWFVLKRGRFVEFPPEGLMGSCRSEVFPGLWLDPAPCSYLRETSRKGYSHSSISVALPHRNMLRFSPVWPRPKVPADCSAPQSAIKRVRTRQCKLHVDRSPREPRYPGASEDGVVSVHVRFRVTVSCCSLAGPAPRTVIAAHSMGSIRSIARSVANSE